MDSDTQVFQDIVDEFKNSPILHYAQLNLHVPDGVVTVSGRVNSPAERRAVERVVTRVAGIRTLILELRAAAIPLTVTRPIVVPSKDDAASNPDREESQPSQY